MPNYKIPGPNGFGPSFYQTTWKTIKKVLIFNIKKFFTRGKILRELNRT